MTIPEFSADLVDPNVRVPEIKVGPKDACRDCNAVRLLRLHDRDGAAEKKSQTRALVTERNGTRSANLPSAPAKSCL
jgi:hypothetical protein